MESEHSVLEGSNNIRRKHAADGTEAVVIDGKLEFSSSKNCSASLVAQGRVEHHQATVSGGGKGAKPGESKEDGGPPA
jgi:hypothetical protein